MVKWKESGKVDFFSKKNLRILFDVVLDAESNDGIFDSLAPFGGDLLQIENLSKIPKKIFA